MKKTVLVDEGRKLIVKCEASGNPTPEYKWYKDGAELRKSKQIKIRNGKWVSMSASTETLQQRVREKYHDLHTRWEFHTLGNVDFALSLLIKVKGSSMHAYYIVKAMVHLLLNI